MTLLRKKIDETKNVYEASLERIHYLFDHYDKIVVSFSGGKDSTIVLNLALQVAKERGKLPLQVVFFDEEAIHPPTIEYVERVRQREEIDLHWYCLEFKHRNACSSQLPYWYCWEKDKKDIWVRDMPQDAITEHSNFVKGMTIPDFSPYLFEPKDGNVCVLTGIRSQESIRRLRLALKRTRENYINQSPHNHNVYKAHPIYDWTADDVWVAIRKFDWDYAKTYDLFAKTRLGLNQQRVCSPWGEEPLTGLWLYAECFPEMWHKMLKRVPAVNTAYRYSRTELYSMPKQPPEGLSWKDYTQLVIQRYPTNVRKTIKETINEAILLHYKKSILPITDQDPDPVSGCHWRFLCKIAIRADLKGRISGSMQIEADKGLRKRNITLNEAMKQYGTIKHKTKFFREQSIKKANREATT